MIETFQPADFTRPDAYIDRRILQGFVDWSQADLATLRTLQCDGCYQVAAAGGRAWPRNALSTGEPLSAAQVAWLSDPKVTVYVADPATDQNLPEWAGRGAQLAGVKAAVFVPMRAGQRFVGFVGLQWRRPRWFRPEQLSRLQLLAAQAAIALDTPHPPVRGRGQVESLAELVR